MVKQMIVRLTWPLILLTFCFAVIFFGHNTFEDHNYNIGVMLKSAAESVSPLLKTSLVHVFYEKYQIERAEDWHRGLSLIIGSLLVRLFHWPGAIKVMHFLYVAMIGAVIAFVANCATQTQQKNSGNRQVLAELNSTDNIELEPLKDYPCDHSMVNSGKTRGLCSAILLLIAISPLGLFVISAYGLDDIPAALLSMVGISILCCGRKRSSIIPLIAGALFGLAFWVKDFYLIWLVIGPLVVLLCYERPSACPRVALGRELLLPASVLVGTTFIVIFGKLCWNYYDYGNFFPNIIRHWIRIFVFGQYTGKEPHYPFYLDNDKSYLSIFEISGGYGSAFIALLLSNLSGFYRLFVANAMIIAPMTSLVFLDNSFLASHEMFRRLFKASLCAGTVYVCFFLAGLGEISQSRYWIVPFTLWFVLSIVFLRDRILRAEVLKCSRIRGCVIVFIYALMLNPVWFLLHAFFSPSPISEALVVATHGVIQNSGREKTIMLNNFNAMYYYSIYQDKVLAIMLPQFVQLEPFKAATWLADYNVRFALISKTDYAAINRLSSLGFQPIIQDSKNIVMQRR